MHAWQSSGARASIHGWQPRAAHARGCVQVSMRNGNSIMTSAVDYASPCLADVELVFVAFDILYHEDRWALGRWGAGWTHPRAAARWWQDVYSTRPFQAQPECSTISEHADAACAAAARAL